MSDSDGNPIMEKITAREVEILGLIAEGLTNREIAQKLALSPETVKWYNKQAFSKLGASNRIQAAAKAKKLGLMDVESATKAETIKPASNNLPAELSSFVGREEELAEVKALLQKARLVTLTGSGGTGKTRVVIRYASTWMGDYSGGAWFCDLAGRPWPRSGRPSRC